ncbi:Aldo keto reductase [Hysterangium stoloniferum]|nr:Aldo keto reductase [Hysterangium stoloniferum]
MPYPTRKIGNADVPAISWGAMGLSAFYGPIPSDEERFKVLDRAFQLGITHWDSSDRYGDSEDLIGKWFKRTGKRDSIFLATKFGFSDVARRVVRCDPPYIKQAVEKSLKRLGVDYIDLYYAHRMDPTVPIEETVAAMAELVKEGKVKYLGLSEASANTIRRANAIHPIAAVQMEYSPFVLYIEGDDSDPKSSILATAREFGTKVIAYSPLGRGLLTGQYKSLEDFDQADFRRHLPKVSDEHFSKIFALVELLNKLGVKYNATAGQICLAWVLAQGDDIIPIPGTKKIKYLDENSDAVKITLTSEEVKEIRKVAIESGAADVPRYPEIGMAMALVETPLPKM